MGKFPKIKFKKTSFDESGFVSSTGNSWKAKTLYEEVEKQKCKKFKMPLAGIDLHHLPFQIDTFDCFIYHSKRVKDCSLEHPIILGPLGEILDGNHRVVKAFLKGKDYIWAYRLQYLPEPDKIIEKE